MKTKKLLALITAICMTVIMAVPTVSFGYDYEEDDENIYCDYGGIMAGNQLVYSPGKTECDPVAGVSFNSDTGTLTLNGYNGDPIHMDLQLGEITVNVVGENTIHTDGDCRCWGMYVEALGDEQSQEDLIFEGSGSLDVVYETVPCPEEDEDEYYAETTVGIEADCNIVFRGPDISIEADIGIVSDYGSVMVEGGTLKTDTTIIAIEADRGIYSHGMIEENGYYSQKVKGWYILGVYGAKAITVDYDGYVYEYNDKAARDISYRVAREGEVTELETLNFDTYVGESVTNRLLNATGAVTWTSSKTKIAKVDKHTGAVNPLKAGTCTITATCQGMKYSYTLNVKKPELSETSVTMFSDEFNELEVIGGKGKTTWKSSSTKICKVDADGNTAELRPVKAGKCTITAKRSGYSMKARVEIVKAPEISMSTISLLPEETYQLSVSGGYGDIQWSTSDEKVATVDENGLVTAGKNRWRDTCTITAERNDYFLVCEVFNEGEFDLLNVHIVEEETPEVVPVNFGKKVNIGYYNGNSDVCLKIIAPETGYVSLESKNFKARFEIYDRYHQELVEGDLYLKKSEWTGVKGYGFAVKKGWSYYIRLKDFEGGYMSDRGDIPEVNQKCSMDLTFKKISDTGGETKMTSQPMKRGTTYKGLLEYFLENDEYSKERGYYEDSKWYKITIPKKKSFKITVNTGVYYHMYVSVIRARDMEMVAGKYLHISDKKKTISVSSKYGAGDYYVEVSPTAVTGPSSAQGWYSICYK